MSILEFDYDKLSKAKKNGDDFLRQFYILNVREMEYEGHKNVLE